MIRSYSQTSLYRHGFKLGTALAILIGMDLDLSSQRHDERTQVGLRSLFLDRLYLYIVASRINYLLRHISYGRTYTCKYLFQSKEVCVGTMFYIEGFFPNDCAESVAHFLVDRSQLGQLNSSRIPYVIWN